MIRKSGYRFPLGTNAKRLPGGHAQKKITLESDSTRLIQTLKENASAAEAGVGPALDLGRTDNLLGLMGVERAGAGRPAFCQNLHREQFGVYFRFERKFRPSFRAGKSGKPQRAKVPADSSRHIRQL